MTKPSEKIQVWLDCDPGLDDTLAIVYASHNERINLIGISTSPGNTNLDNTTQNALDILHNIGRSDIDVYAGSYVQLQGQVVTAQLVHGHNGLGGVNVKQSPKQAFRTGSFAMIYDKLMKQEGQVVWTNIGSLTNLSLLLMTFPSVKAKISKIVMMGGAIQKGNITPAAQFNIHCDPQAFDRVLKIKGDIPLVMIPLEVTHQFPANKQVYDAFKSHTGHPFGQALYNMALHYQKFYQDVNNIQFPPYHDPVTIFYLLYPEEFEVKPTKIEVDIFATSYGRTNCNFEQGLKDKTTMVATKMIGSLDKFWKELLQSTRLIFSEEIQSKVK